MSEMNFRRLDGGTLIKALRHQRKLKLVKTIFIDFISPAGCLVDGSYYVQKVNNVPKNAFLEENSDESNVIHQNTKYS